MSIKVILTHFWSVFPFYTPPGSTRRGFFVWWFQRIQNKNIDQKWVNDFIFNFDQNTSQLSLLLCLRKYLFALKFIWRSSLCSEAKEGQVASLRGSEWAIFSHSIQNFYISDLLFCKIQCSLVLFVLITSFLVTRSYICSAVYFVFSCQTLSSFLEIICSVSDWTSNLPQWMHCRCIVGIRRRVRRTIRE